MEKTDIERKYRNGGEEAEIERGDRDAGRKQIGDRYVVEETVIKEGEVERGGSDGVEKRDIKGNRDGGR